MTSKQTINIDINKIVGKDTGLIVNKQSKMELSTDVKPEDARFLEKLDKEQQDQIYDLAPKIVDSFLEDQNKLIDFGEEAVSGVNTMVNKILSEQKTLEIPQVDELLSNTNKELNGFIVKYKNATLTPVELEKKPNFFERLFKKTSNQLQEFKFEAQNIEQKMDSMAAVLVKHEDTLSRNIVTAEMLLEENNKSIEDLIGVIAFLEGTEIETAKRANDLKEEIESLEQEDPIYQIKSSELANITSTLNLIERQHTEYVSRLFIAWGTTPQMRNLMEVSSNMKQKLSLLRRNTIPTMKLSISQLGLMQQSMRSGVTADAIIDANNAALQMLAETGSVVVPKLAETAQKSTVTPESVIKLAESIVAQNDGIVQAITEGRKNRALLEETIMKSAKEINSSMQTRDKRIIEAILTDNESAINSRKVKDAEVIEPEQIEE